MTPHVSITGGTRLLRRESIERGGSSQLGREVHHESDALTLALVGLSTGCMLFVPQETLCRRWSWTGMGCDEYVLTFDRQGILRRWTHKSEFHGGERMPTYCVADGFKPGS